MEIIGYVAVATIILLGNTLLFNTLIEDEDDGFAKPIKILLFIPPFSFIGTIIILIIMAFSYIIESVKKV